MILNLNRKVANKLTMQEQNDAQNNIKTQGKWAEFVFNRNYTGTLTKFFRCSYIRIA
jgi:hypothetical protein